MRLRKSARHSSGVLPPMLSRVYNLFSWIAGNWERTHGNKLEGGIVHLRLEFGNVRGNVVWGVAFSAHGM